MTPMGTRPCRLSPGVMPRSPTGNPWEGFAGEKRSPFVKKEKELC